MLVSSPRFNILGLFWAAIQLIVPPGLAIADSLVSLRAGGFDAPSHVEAGPGQGCVPMHPTDCAVCRFLSAFADRTRTHDGSTAVPARAAVVCRDADRIAARPHVQLPLSRAPPAA
jgi:hypothetical protein